MTGELKLGASAAIVDGSAEWPIHGLRHPATGDSSGWYVWSGELSDAEDFFQQRHHDHFAQTWPQLTHLLDLPPGSRFLCAPGHEDVWEDASLLDV